MHLLMVTVLIMTALVTGIYSQDIDEDLLFSDTSSITDSASVLNRADESDAESITVDFSGAIYSILSAIVDNEFFDDFGSNHVFPSAAMIGNVFLDIRLPFNNKAFINGEVISNSDSSAFLIRELFLDATFNKRIYLRTGKQVLQWGRCYSWNPTDLINVERRSFIEKIGSREGSYGIRLHVPFGTAFNLYSFLDLNEFSSVDSVAGTAKAEFLIGSTEAAFSVWGKRYRDPFAGFDLSTGYKGYNFSAELAVTTADNFSKVEFINNEPRIYSAGDDLIARVCAGVSKTYDLFEVDDRISVNAEFYYNQAGIDENYFDLVAGFPQAQQFSAVSSLISLYEQNSYSKYYASLFTTVNKFIISDLSLTVNSMINLNQSSAMLTTALNYATLHNLSIGFLANYFLGPENTEYTFFYDGFLARVTAGVSF